MQSQEELNRQVVKTTRALTWLDAIATFEQELLIVDVQQRDWRLRQDAFQPVCEKFQQANQALELAGEYASLISLRGEQVTEHQHHAECLVLLPTQEAAVTQNETVVSLANQTLEQKKLEQKQASLIIRKVSELDLKRLKKDVPIKAVMDAVSEQGKSLDLLRTKHDDSRKALSSKNKAFDNVLRHLSETKVDEGLIEHPTGICNRLDVFKRLHAQQKTKVDEINVAETLAADTTRVWHEHSENVDTQ